MRRYSHPALAKRRPKIGHRSRPKKNAAPEIVTKCDHCGKPLGRTCARTAGSFVCAVGDGIPSTVKYDIAPNDGKTVAEYHFYCSSGCREAAG